MVLPLPVGPVTRTIPWGRAIHDSKRAALLLVEPELREVLEEDLGIEDPEDDLLSEGHRDGGHPQLHLPVPAPRLDAAVLGPTLLGDVHPRQDLQPRDDGRVDPARHLVDVVEDPVDAHAHHGVLALGLHVDVGGPLVEGVVEQVLHGVDHRPVVGLQALLVGEVDELLEIAHLAVHVDHRLVQGGVDAGLEAVDVGDALEDVGLGAEHRPDLRLDHVAKVLEEHLVPGVGDRQLHHPVDLGEGQAPVAPGEAAAHGPGDELHVELQGIDLPGGEAEGLAHQLGDPVLVEEVALAPGVGELEGGDELHRRDR